MSRKVVLPKEIVIKLYQMDFSTQYISKMLHCSVGPIRKFLRERKLLKGHRAGCGEKNPMYHKSHSTKQLLQIQKWRKAAWNAPRSEKQFEQCQKMGQAPKTKNQLIGCQKGGQKAGPININCAIEWNAKNGAWISRPEALFYITRLSKNFYLKDIVPQYYIKKIKHRVDFAIPSQKLLFEVDGDYYHGHSGNAQIDKERIKRDKEIDKWAKENGWTIFRYTDKDMRKLGIIK